MELRFPITSDKHECTRFEKNYPQNTTRFIPDDWYVEGSDFDSTYDYEGHPSRDNYDGWTHLTCSSRCRCPCCGRRNFCARDLLIIAIHGACSTSGTEKKRTGVGVWFGVQSPTSGSKHNVSRATDETTKEAAEIRAALVALESYSALKKDGLRKINDKTIILKTDSAHLVDGITKNIERWKARGWQSTTKKPVANKELWEKLEERVMNKTLHGTRVLFWKVPKGWNRQARVLAEAALLDDSSEQKEKMVQDAAGEYVTERRKWMKDYEDECKALALDGPNDRDLSKLR